MPETIILALNSGSSSLKFGIFSGDHGDVRPLCSGAVEGINTDSGSFWIRDADGKTLKKESHTIADQQEAIRTVAEGLEKLPYPRPAAIGHRIVHGGPKLLEHQLITSEVFKELEAAAVFAPLHVPVALAMIRQAEKHFPDVPQFACFDTAFHRTLPESASHFAMPQKYWKAGVRRYGFHGLSCESILHVLGKEVPPRMVIAHLGSGASITAISNGSSVDTTMGLTPTGGIVMATRTGDLDPGVILYLLRAGHFGAEELENLLDKKSGLLGISGVTADMRQLHQAVDNPDAQLAVEIFCRSAKKAIGGFVAILGGLDLLVFTGGIGEHDSIAREQICRGLEPLGITVDLQKNQRSLRQISSDSSKVSICVLQSQEDLQIARHTYRLVSQQS
jgi:acetate kinase